jgi:hypothetical protein
MRHPAVAGRSHSPITAPASHGFWSLEHPASSYRGRVWLATTNPQVRENDELDLGLQKTYVFFILVGFCLVFPCFSIWGSWSSAWRKKSQKKPQDTPPLSVFYCRPLCFLIKNEFFALGRFAFVLFFRTLTNPVLIPWWPVWGSRSGGAQYHGRVQGGAPAPAAGGPAWSRPPPPSSGIHTKEVRSINLRAPPRHRATSHPCMCAHSTGPWRFCSPALVALRRLVFLSPRRCLRPIWSNPSGQFAILCKYQRGPHGMLGLQWAVFPHSFAGGGREGHCEHVGALVPIIYDASTRPMVVDSIREGRTSSRCRFLSMPGLGDADGTFVFE